MARRWGLFPGRLEELLTQLPPIDYLRTARKFGIIGMGWVGSSVAISPLHTGIATELLVHDAKTGLAEGEAWDLAQRASFYPSGHVRAAEIDELIDADAVGSSSSRIQWTS